MAGKFCAVLRGPGIDGEAAVLAFTTALSALRGGGVVVFLTEEGVRLSLRGVAERIRIDGMPGLREVMDMFLASGGSIWVCGHSFRNRGLDHGAIVHGARIVGRSSLVEFLGAGVPCVTF